MSSLSSNNSEFDFDHTSEDIYPEVFKTDTYVDNKNNEECTRIRKEKTKYLIHQLLIDIYGQPFSFNNNYNYECRSNESDCNSVVSNKSYGNYSSSHAWNDLSVRDTFELKTLSNVLKNDVYNVGNELVRHLGRRDRLRLRHERHCYVITEYLRTHAHCLGDENINMRFSLSPASGDSGYGQWLDAMKMVTRLPGGIPPEFRKKLWITLAERHLQHSGIEWSKAEVVCFNECSNPDDNELGVQIVKDLHRTGCSLFCGTAGQENQVLLKRVLLAYARWNKAVGYCQGFNMLAALILQVMDRNEVEAVKVMIYLIEGVLPESYFANNLRGLSVDMAVFRDLLKLRLPHLSRHLEALQTEAHEGTSYEPPLTNVFTMQWFLTLFCNCLPQDAVLRVWDLIFLEGNEVLLRTTLAIWDGLADRILQVSSADEFYSVMGVLTRDMQESWNADTLLRNVVSAQSCGTELAELRDRYTFNITPPWTHSVQAAARRGFRLFYSDDDDGDSDNDEKMAVTTAAYGLSLKNKKERRSSSTNSIQPYIYGHSDKEKLALDITTLKQQYVKLRERQRQAHIILTAACARQTLNTSSSASPIVMNHLLLGKSALVVRGRRLGPPKGAVPPSRHASMKPRNTRFISSKSGETLHWKDAQKKGKSTKTTAEITKYKEQIEEDEEDSSSSYSENGDSSSSTSTELCDEPGRMSDFDGEDSIGSRTFSEEHSEMVTQVAKQVAESLTAKCDLEDEPPRATGIKELSLKDELENVGFSDPKKSVFETPSYLEEVENSYCSTSELVRTTELDEFNNSNESSSVNHIKSSNSVSTSSSEKLPNLDNDVNIDNNKKQITKSSVERKYIQELNIENFDFEKFMRERLRLKYTYEIDMPNTNEESTERKNDLNSEDTRDAIFEEQTEFYKNECESYNKSINLEKFENYLDDKVVLIKKSNSNYILKNEDIKTSSPIDKKDYSLFLDDFTYDSTVPAVDEPQQIDQTLLDMTEDVLKDKRHKLNVEKQFSLDSLLSSDFKIEPVRRNSEMALKIIQENSIILHKIMQCQSKSIDIVEEELIDFDEVKVDTNLQQPSDYETVQITDSNEVLDVLIDSSETKTEDTLKNYVHSTEGINLEYDSEKDSKENTSNIEKPESLDVISKFETGDLDSFENIETFKILSPHDFKESSSNIEDISELFKRSRYDVNEDYNNLITEKTDLTSILEEPYSISFKDNECKYKVEGRTQDIDDLQTDSWKYLKIIRETDNTEIENMTANLSQYKISRQTCKIPENISSPETCSNFYCDEAISLSKNKPMNLYSLSDHNYEPKSNFLLNTSLLKSPDSPQSPCISKFMLQNLQLSPLSPTRKSVHSPLSPNKQIFTPFPVSNANRQPKNVGFRLGLYKDYSPPKSPTK